MAKKGNIRRISDKKKNRPKIRFSFWMMIIIFAVTFAGCFVVYMIAANIDDDFFNDQFKTVVEESSSDSLENEESVSDDSIDNTDETEADVQTVIQNPVPSSAAMDVSYLESCCLVTDSTLLGMTDYGFNSVFGNEELNAVSIETTKIATSYGTVTMYETLKIKKPTTVYIMLGSDIGVSDVKTMVTTYMSFLSKLKTALLDMNIYIMQLPPAYADAEKNTQINEYNTRLLEIANSLGVYCIDTNTELKNNEGNLKEEYYDAETGTYTSEYYDAVCGYILTHTA